MHALRLATCDPFYTCVSGKDAAATFILILFVAITAGLASHHVHTLARTSIRIDALHLVGRTDQAWTRHTDPSRGSRATSVPPLVCLRAPTSPPSPPPPALFHPDCFPPITLLRPLSCATPSRHKQLCGHPSVFDTRGCFAFFRCVRYASTYSPTGLGTLLDAPRVQALRDDGGAAD